MPRFGVEIGPDRSFFSFRYSPLGLPSCNLVYEGTVASDLPRTLGVRFYGTDATGTEWYHQEWPQHLWWLRLLLHTRTFPRRTAASVWSYTQGTRWEHDGQLRHTEVVLQWWLTHTSVEQRTAFLQNPDPYEVIRSVCVRGPPGDRRKAKRFAGLLRLIRRNGFGEELFRPLAYHVRQRTQYSGQRSLMALQRVLRGPLFRCTPPYYMESTRLISMRCARRLRV